MGDVVDVRQAVNRLTADLRELVELIHWDGFSVVEAARLLAIAASTARSRYATAKGHLHSALAAVAEQPFTAGY